MAKKGLFNAEIKLVEGSVLRVLSLGTREEMLVSRGVFKGYTGIGSDEGFCMGLREDDVEFIRIIPTHMILAVDILEQAEEEGEEREEEIPASYYG
ncbi:MAG: hypothetical protein J7L61_03130 [Thermoplasmata archaeon]|nr:hypothetical protein [Thermoplasmata archaeon]